MKNNMYNIVKDTQNFEQMFIYCIKIDKKGY